MPGRPPAGSVGGVNAPRAAGPAPSPDEDQVLYQVSRAVLAVTRQLSVRDVLQVIVRSARSLSGARYAALGVPDAQGSFAEFVVDGITARQQKAIGPLPRQHGMLAVLLKEAQAAAARRHPRRPAVRRLVAVRPSRARRLPRRADQGRPGRARHHLRRQQDRPRRLHRAGRAAARPVRGARGDRADQRPAVRAGRRAVGDGGAGQAGQGAARRGVAEAVQHPGQGPGRVRAGRPGIRPAPPPRWTASPR